MKRSRCVQDDPADERFCVGCRSPARRTVLKVGLGLGVGLWWSGSASTQEVDPRAARPREDDRFVLAGRGRSGGGGGGGGGPPRGPGAGYPEEPAAGVGRGQSRLKQALPVHLVPQGRGARR